NKKPLQNRQMISFVGFAEVIFLKFTLKLEPKRIADRLARRVVLLALRA
ncbi:MAG: hypothetical protein JWR50_1802, partial [Mucilaginibacter sp.]|nr:hypothetical protein [Mucilaginibacter sp.]